MAAANSTTSNPVVASGSGLASCSDRSGNGTDYIFYQTSNGSLVQALCSYGGSGTAYQFHDFKVLTSASKNTKLTCIYNDGSIANTSAGAVVYYQASASSNEISYLQVDRSGNESGSGKVVDD